MKKIFFAVVALFGVLACPCHKEQALAGDPVAYNEKMIQRNVAISSYVKDRKWVAADFQSLVEPNAEVDAAILFLRKVKPDDRPFIRFFTTYAVPPNLREQTVLTLSFVIHSLVAVGDNSKLGYHPLAVQKNDVFTPLQNVPGSQTLWWIDLRDYNWTVDAWEIVSSADGYFVEPIINQVNNQILTQIVGTPNVILRADWFIVQATDTAKQDDLGLGFNIYDTLIFAQLKRPPANRDEWVTLFTGIRDLNESRLLGNEYGTIVTNSAIVSRANRFLFSYSTETGYLYETFDIKNQQGRRDFIEGLLQFKGNPPGNNDFDAGELIASNPLYMQVYAIIDAQGNLINQADPTVVRHATDITGDVRVRKAYSCMDCHGDGIIPAENTLKDLLKGGGKLHIQDEDVAEKIQRTFLTNGFETSVDRSNGLYAAGMSRVNGLTPEKNGFNFLAVSRFYVDPVDIKKAAMECGVTIDQFKARLNGRVTGRLALLVTQGTPIPRNIWESPGRDGIPGTFQQAMFILNGIDYAEQQDFNDFIINQNNNINQNVLINGVTKKRLLNNQKKTQYVEVQKGFDVQVYHGNDIVTVGHVNPGQLLLTNGQVHDNWLAVLFNEQWAWVRKDLVSDIRKK